MCIKRNYIIGLLILMLLFGAGYDSVFAASDETVASASDIIETGDVETFATTYYNVTFEKVTSTKARILVNARVTGTPKKIKSKIVVEKYNSSLGKYVEDASYPAKTVESYSINHEVFHTISASGKYRVTVTLTHGTDVKEKTQTLS